MRRLHLFWIGLSLVSLAVAPGCKHTSRPRDPEIARSAALPAAELGKRSDAAAEPQAPTKLPDAADVSRRIPGAPPGPDKSQALAAPKTGDSRAPADAGRIPSSPAASKKAWLMEVPPSTTIVLTPAPQRGSARDESGSTRTGPRAEAARAPAESPIPSPPPLADPVKAAAVPQPPAPANLPPPVERTGPVNTPAAVPAPPTAPVAVRPAEPVPSNYSHADDYTMLTGKVYRWRRTWRLRYAPLDQPDRYGGSVVLAGDTDQLREGQFVRIRGQLIPPESRSAEPVFQVQAIEKLAAK